MHEGLTQPREKGGLPLFPYLWSVEPRRNRESKKDWNLQGIGLALNSSSGVRKQANKEKYTASGKRIAL